MNHRAFAFVAVVSACAPVAAFAQALDLTPYAGRILSDPEFLPLTGQVYGTTAYTHGWVDGSSVDSLGAETSTFHINTNTLAQSLAYGIADDVSVGASIQYAPQDYRAVDYTNGQSAYLNSSGFSDPTFGATWRVLEQNTFPANFDLFGSYTPDWISAHTASAIQDGTVARGGDSGIIGAALGLVTQGFSIRGAFDADFLGQSSVLNLSNGDVIQAASHTNFDLWLDTQTRLTDLFSVNAGLSHTFASSAAVNLANGGARLDEPGDSTSLKAALNYNFLPNALVISATYAHDFYGNSNTLYADPVFDTQTRGRNGDTLGVKLYYTMP